MRLEDVRFGCEHEYIHKKSGRKCYVANQHVDDGAYLIVGLFNEDGSDYSGEFVGCDAAGLKEIDRAAG